MNLRPMPNSFEGRTPNVPKKQILQLLSEGRSQRWIASNLSVSRNSISKVQTAVVRSKQSYQTLLLLDEEALVRTLFVLPELLYRLCTSLSISTDYVFEGATLSNEIPSDINVFSLFFRQLTVNKTKRSGR